MKFDDLSIPTYIINLEERKERRAHILEQFKGRPEFEIRLVEAVKHDIGAVGLWNSILNIINMATANDDDVIVICEDDHEFTADYNKEYLISNVVDAHMQSCDVLNGGVGHFDRAIPITRNRYWVDSFCSLQFAVIYKKFFNQILAEPFLNTDVADLKYSEMTSNKMILYPFISRQHDFGYSDVTPIHNEERGIVDFMFARSEMRLKIYQDIYDKYIALNQ